MIQIAACLTVLLYLAVITSCGDQTAGDVTGEKKYSQDTVFVTIAVNQSNRDSLEKIYGRFLSAADQALIQQGEFISASIRLTIPLLPKGWVNDFEDLYTLPEEARLDSLIRDFESQTSQEIAVVTIDSSWSTREELDRFVIRLHNAWRVGKEGKDNGIVIGISKGLRMIRISNGKGLARKITNDETNWIVKEFAIPEFENGGYYTGTRKCIFALMSELRQP